MPHSTPLISTIVGGLVVAFALGLLAQRVRISPLVGYLAAGVLVGPFTPGFVADQPIANELAEIGVVLLMFGVGLHFSLADLLAVRMIAVPGALVQIAAATAMGIALALGLGWSVGGGIVFGLALSVASTVVLLRALQDRRLLETDRGRIAVGWLIVEDLAMVLALVLLPVLSGLIDNAQGAAGFGALLKPIGVTLLKVIAFVALMLIVGKRVIPWIMHYVAHTGSRELFRLAVLVIALGVAFGAATLFDVSFALGAFFAGMILSESELSHRAASETLPLRDAFAVLFFVSVGMLFDPTILWRDTGAVLATLFIIVLGKSLAAFLIVRAFKHPSATALTISASLAQIGEFSFILASLGVELGLLPERGRDLILAGALLSILVNPLLFSGLDKLLAHKAPSSGTAGTAREPLPATELASHVVLMGYGRVGRVIGAALGDRNIPFLVVENDPEIVARLKEQGIETISANAVEAEVAAAANFAAARCLLVAIPDAFEGGQAVQRAREIHPTLPIFARSHSDEETAHLLKHGATSVIMGENEIAKAMLGLVAAT